MLVLNGQKLARQLTDETSVPDIVGTYRVLARKISLFDLSGKLMGVITNRRVLAKASLLDDGRVWYSYGDIPAIGRYESYLAHMGDIETALREHGIQPVRE